MRKLTLSEWIEKAKKVHNDKYDYSKVNIDDDKVCIICPTHGEFLQRKTEHIYGYGCKKCGTISASKKISQTNEDFIERAKQIHGSKYDYSKVNYKNANEKICIICPTHGEFWQKPSKHLLGQGCPKCSNRSFKYTLNEIIEKMNYVHENKYDYSKTEYHNIKEKICIICPTHGEFWQKPTDHLRGNGCPKCSSSKLENTIRKFLIDENIEFVEQKSFEWLKNNHGVQSLDFYIPSKNIAIECQGEQHFFAKDYFGGENEFVKQKERDKRKKQLCNEHGIKILYYTNLGIDYPYKVYEDTEELLKEIKNA